MNIKGFEQSLEPFFCARVWWVGYSGGMDSHLLLTLLQQLLRSDFAQSFDRLPHLKALHINHQLQPQAAAWELHCQRVCDDLAVPLLIERVNIPKGGNTEALARQARYAVFTQQLCQQDVLFLGHHQDDQLETFFYRLARGAGVKGLSAMAWQRDFPCHDKGSAVLVRPLLHFSHAELLEVAQSKQLSWVNDSSNADTVYDRNYLRHKVLPLFKRRWPALARSVTRVIKHLQEHQQLLSELAVEDLARCDVQAHAFWREHSIALADVFCLSHLRSKNLLRHWLALHELSLNDKQDQMLWQALTANKTEQKFLLQIGECSLRIFNRRLYCSQSPLPVLTTETFRWQANDALPINDFMQLSLSEAVNVTLTVKFRQGGEQCLLHKQSQHKSLKNILQEASIPPWHRSVLPLIYHGDILIAIADLYLLAPARAVLGEDNRIIMTRLSNDHQKLPDAKL